VTREVLPAIRKTGGYLLNEEAREKAHADDRQGMPLQEVFAEALLGLTKTLEQQGQLLACTLTRTMLTSPASGGDKLL
jgi:hypothetical protein